MSYYDDDFQATKSSSLLMSGNSDKSGIDPNEALMSGEWWVK